MEKLLADLVIYMVKVQKVPMVLMEDSVYRDQNVDVDVDVDQTNLEWKTTNNYTLILKASGPRATKSNNNVKKVLKRKGPTMDRKQK